MKTRSTSRNTPNRMEAALVRTGSRTSEPRSMHLPNSSTSLGRHRSFVRSVQKPPVLQQQEVADLLADIEGLSVLVRSFVEDLPAEMQSGLVSKDADLHSLLSSTFKKMVDRMRGSSLRVDDDPLEHSFATVELMPSAEQLVRPPPLSNETVLRVGPLELDLLDRTAKRGDRQIDLRPREFQLLKYMMQRSDKLLTRATLLKEVWRYKFVPETNLVDVHMGRLRRKVDGPSEPSLIRNVRGVGFVLSATPFSPCSPPKSAERSATRPSDSSPGSVERMLQW
jgi:DNA-binding winged helix-turn-helix (wHTH) protein